MGEEYKIGYEIKTLDHMLFRNFLSAARSCGLDEMTVMHGWILGYLYRNTDKEIFQRDIEAQFSIGRSSVTGILKLMEKKGYIERERVSRDARLKKLLLTENGRQTHLKAWKLLQELDRELMEGLTEQELKSFLQVIAKIKANSERQRERWKGGHSCGDAPAEPEGLWENGEAELRGGNDD